MRRDDVDKFLADAGKRIQAAKDGRVPPEYLTLLEAQFHRMDNERTRIPLWPCNLDLVPAPAIREMVGPASYRLYNYGLAEHFWLIRHVCGFRGDQQLLDVGCGFGKTAIALLRLIRPPGSYTGFDIQPGWHPIVPIRLGEAPLAQGMAKDLLGEGIYVVGFFFPVVARGQARIRVQLSAAHERARAEIGRAHV